MPAPFPIDEHLVAIAVAYKNPVYIGDLVLPRVPVSKEEFKWWEYPIAESFAMPDNKVGRRSIPNEVELTATEQTSSTQDYGLDDVVPNQDIMNAPANHDPLGRAVMQIEEYNQLNREKRVADLVHTAANYPTGNKVTLAGNDQWSAFSTSDPIDDILTALDAPLVRPNVAVLGQEVWTKLRAHPLIAKAVHGNAGDAGVASRQAIADLFELEEILVGPSRRNTAKKGQTATLARVWGKHAAFLYRDRNADTNGGLTFGYTAQFGGKVAGQMDEPKIGLKGSVRVRNGESVKELIVASQAGYLITDAVA